MNQNVALVKQMYEAFGRGDVAAIAAVLAPDVLWSFEANDKLSWAGIRRGPQEAMGFFAGIAHDLADSKLEITEFVAEGDIVATFGHYSATVKKTGKAIRTPVAHYFRFKDGKGVEFRNFVNSAAIADAMG